MGYKDSVQEAISKRLSGFTGRDRAVLVGRLILRPRTSLEELGNRHNVTRERVRQLEAQIKSEMRLWLDSEEVVRAFCEQVVEATGTIAPLEKVLQKAPEILDPISIHLAPDETLTFPAWQVIQHLDESFEGDGGRFFLESIDKVELRFDAHFTVAAGEDEFLLLEHFLKAFAGWGAASPDELLIWAQSRGYKVILGALVSPGVKAMHDLAAIALRINGSPMTTEELHGIVATSKSIRSLANQMSAESKLQRVGADSWGLVEWGGERFSSIRNAILARVDVSGSALLQDLIDEMVEKFGVAESSVKAYSGAWPLKCERGVVSRDDSHSTPQGRPFAKSRGCFISDLGFAFRTQVTSDHLRGSGSQFPTALAVALGISIGETLLFKIPGTPKSIRLRWKGSQATISTIRADLEILQAQIGDEIVITFIEGDAHFSKLPNPLDEPFMDLGRLCLIPPATPVTRISIARAIGLDETTVWDEILQSALARKDEQLTAAIQRVIHRLLNPA